MELDPRRWHTAELTPTQIVWFVLAACGALFAVALAVVLAFPDANF